MKTIHLNFIGKDSVPYDNDLEVPDEIYDALKALTKGKQPSDQLFKNSDAGKVTQFLREVHPTITLKAMRTVVCNETLVEALKKQSVSAASTEAEKLRAIFNANYDIAKTLNHQKGVGKKQAEGEQKADERAVRAEERKDALFDKVAQKQKELKVEEEKIREAFKGMKILDEKLAALEEKRKKLTEQYERAVRNVEKAKLGSEKKKLTATIALGTSLAAYADPKVIFSWAKEVDLPIEKIYTKSNLKLFDTSENRNVSSKYWRSYPS